MKAPRKAPAQGEHHHHRPAPPPARPIVHYFPPSTSIPHPPTRRCRCGGVNWADAKAWWRSPEGLVYVSVAAKDLHYCEAPE